jgi:hypothetical protein
MLHIGTLPAELAVGAANMAQLLPSSPICRCIAHFLRIAKCRIVRHRWLGPSLDAA